MSWLYNDAALEGGWELPNMQTIGSLPDYDVATYRNWPAYAINSEVRSHAEFPIPEDIKASLIANAKAQMLRMTHAKKFPNEPGREPEEWPQSNRYANAILEVVVGPAYTLDSAIASGDKKLIKKVKEAIKIHFYNTLITDDALVGLMNAGSKNPSSPTDPNGAIRLLNKLFAKMNSVRKLAARGPIGSNAARFFGMANRSARRAERMLNYKQGTLGRTLMADRNVPYFGWAARMQDPARWKATRTFPPSPGTAAYLKKRLAAKTLSGVRKQLRAQMNKEQLKAIAEASKAAREATALARMRATESLREGIADIANIPALPQRLDIGDAGALYRTYMNELRNAATEAINAEERAQIAAASGNVAMARKEYNDMLRLKQKAVLAGDEAERVAPNAAAAAAAADAADAAADIGENMGDAAVTREGEIDDEPPSSKRPRGRSARRRLNNT